MTPMKKTELVGLPVLALMAAIGFFVLVFTSPEPPVTKRSSARIDRTMTENDPMDVRKPPAGDWPMYRRDPALTAASPLRGGLADAPEVAWSIDLGGPKTPSERVVV